MTNPLLMLQHFGQSLWLDYFHRSVIHSGELERLIREDGLRGLASNPTIFRKAIACSDAYEGSIANLARQGLNASATHPGEFGATRACSQFGSVLPSHRVRVFNRSRVTTYAAEHAGARPSLLAWFDEVVKALWEGADDVKRRYPSASIINKERVVFNIGGNNYRVIVMVKYQFHAVYIRFIGTHAEYNEVDAANV